MVETTIEYITPKKAAEYLEHNKLNRAIRSRHLELLIREMKAGNWKLTHQGIAFDEAGNLLDGQHRLTAVVLSGVTIQSMVTRDLPQQAARSIDTQATRNYNDSHVFDNKDRPAIFKNTRAQAAVRGLCRFAYKQHYQLINSQVDSLMAAWRDKLEALDRAAMRRTRNAGATINAAMLAALLNGEDEADIFSFYSVYMLGDTKYSEGRNIQAPFRLANAVMKEKEKFGRLNRERMHNIAQNAVWQYIHCDKTTMLKATDTLRYPAYDMIEKILKGDKENA